MPSLDWVTALALVATVFAIISGLYAFSAQIGRLFRTRRRPAGDLPIEEPPAPPSAKIAELFWAPQQHMLEVWRLFDFPRDIKMMDVYVQEVLAAGTGAPGTSLVPNSPPIPDSEVFERLCGDITAGSQTHVVIGRAGSGKSTLLRNWMLRLAVTHQRSAPERVPPIPLYISLKYLPRMPRDDATETLTLNDLIECFARTVPSIEEGAIQYLRARMPALHRLGTQPEHTKRASRSKKVATQSPEWILFCDGLDELAQELRPQLLHALAGLPQTVRIVLTSRPNVIEDAGPIPRSVFYSICDFNGEQIGQFTSQWFRDNSRLGDALAHELHDTPSLSKLAAIPLLLTCLCIDVEVREDATFPSTLLESDLLRRIVVIILDGWDAMKNGRPTNVATTQLGMAVFTKAALEHSYDTRLDYAYLKTRVDEAATALGVSREAADTFLERMVTSGWLLDGSPAQGFLFSHAVLWDFFFAMGMRSAVINTTDI